MIATTGLDLVLAIVVTLGALGVTGIIAGAAALTSVRAGERNHELALLRERQAGETTRHKATLDHKMHQAAVARDDRRHPMPLGPPDPVTPIRFLEEEV